MRNHLLMSAAFLVILAGVPAAAEEAAEAMPAMKHGEAVAISPDGHMGRMMVSEAKVSELLKISKPLYDCVMLLTGPDGKTYLVNTSSHEPMVECENMAK